MVYDFQNNENVKLFFASESTVIEGLTLTAASKMCLLTIPWDFDGISQIYSRLQRIGQKNTVNLYLLMVKETIDNYILNLVETKEDAVSQVIYNKK